MNDDPNGNWYDFIMNDVKITIQCGTFCFKESGESFTLKGYFLKMITDYKFNEPNSPDAKFMINFSDELSFDQHASGNKRTRDNYVEKYHYN